MSKEYSTAPVPAATMAMVRIVIVAAGSYAVGRGWVDEGSVEQIATLVITVGTGLWGLYKTFKRQKQITVAETLVGPLKQKV